MLRRDSVQAKDHVRVVRGPHAGATGVVIRNDWSHDPNQPPVAVRIERGRTIYVYAHECETLEGTDQES